jgi:hypothetical protein
VSQPQFKNLCSYFQGFTIYKQQMMKRPRAYPGMAVASPAAFYFAIHLERMRGMTGAALGGALGGAIEGLVAGMKKPAKKKYLPLDVPLVEEMDLTDVPRDVTAHPDWPVTWTEGPVIAVPSKAIVSLRSTWWMGGIRLELDGVGIHITTPFLKRKKMVAYLLDVGWTVT